MTFTLLETHANALVFLRPARHIHRLTCNITLKKYSRPRNKHNMFIAACKILSVSWPGYLLDYMFYATRCRILKYGIYTVPNYIFLILPEYYNVCRYYQVLINLFASLIVITRESRVQVLPGPNMFGFLILIVIARESTCLEV
jgi:hypothetical protein